VHDHDVFFSTFGSEDFISCDVVVTIEVASLEYFFGLVVGIVVAALIEEPRPRCNLPAAALLASKTEGVLLEEVVDLLSRELVIVIHIDLVHYHDVFLSTFGSEDFISSDEVVMVEVTSMEHLLGLVVGIVLAALLEERRALCNLPTVALLASKTEWVLYEEVVDFFPRKFVVIIDINLVHDHDVLLSTFGSEYFISSDVVVTIQVTSLEDLLSLIVGIVVPLIEEASHSDSIPLLAGKTERVLLEEVVDFLSRKLVVVINIDFVHDNDVLFGSLGSEDFISSDKVVTI
jgi:hypothetical protein